MSVRYPPKTSFNTLYLIEKEMFDRILPLLNEVEKQELNDLQERNKPYQDPEEGDENIGQPTATSEISQDEVKIGSSKKSTKSNLGRKNITCTSKMRLNTHSVRTSKMHKFLSSDSHKRRSKD